MKKTYYAVWIYIGNASSKPVPIDAESPEDATEMLRRFYSADFSRKATVMIFEAPPLLISEPDPRRRSMRNETCDAIREMGDTLAIHGVNVKRLSPSPGSFEVDGHGPLGVAECADEVIDLYIKRNPA